MQLERRGWDIHALSAESGRDRPEITRHRSIPGTQEHQVTAEARIQEGRGWGARAQEEVTARGARVREGAAGRGYGSVFWVQAHRAVLGPGVVEQ